MSKYMTVTGILIILLAIAAPGPAEKETEVYIPIGQSPGVSGEYAAMGKIEQVNYPQNTLTMSSGSGTYTVKVSKRTQIYLDRSKTGQPNLYGSLADCKPGMTIEVRFEQDERGRPADWIKLKMQ